MFRAHAPQDGGARKQSSAATGPGHAPTALPRVAIRVRDVMSRDMVVLPAWFSAADANTRCWGRHAAYPVVDADGAPVGLLGPATSDADETITDLTIAQICRPLNSVPVLAPDEDVDILLDMPLFAGATAALVVENNRLIGVVSAGYLLRLARGRASLYVPSR